MASTSGRVPDPRGRLPARATTQRGGVQRAVDLGRRTHRRGSPADPPGGRALAELPDRLRPRAHPAGASLVASARRPEPVPGKSRGARQQGGQSPAHQRARHGGLPAGRRPERDGAGSVPGTAGPQGAGRGGAHLHRGQPGPLLRRRVRRMRRPAVPGLQGGRDGAPAHQPGGGRNTRLHPDLRRAPDQRALHFHVRWTHRGRAAHLSRGEGSVLEGCDVLPGGGGREPDRPGSLLDRSRHPGRRFARERGGHAPQDTGRRRRGGAQPGLPADAGGHR